MHSHPYRIHTGQLLRASAFGALILLLLLCTPALAVAAPGDPDPSFGNGGYVTFDFGERSENVSAVALQPDGSIVVLGTASNAARNSDILLLRYTPAGTLDSSFGSGGFVTTGLAPGSSDEGYALLLQPDGKIVVGGYTVNGPGGSNALLARYNVDGALDASFGDNGVLITDFPGMSESIAGIALQNDGSIVAVGSTCICTENSTDMVVARFSPDGSLDPTFGADGFALTDFGNTGDLAMKVVVQSNGSILVAGYTNNGRDMRNIALVRYLSSGSLDPNFGVNGSMFHSIGDWNSTVRDMALQPDGKIVLVGDAREYIDPGNYATRIGLARFLTDGSLDASFGSGGVTMANPRAPMEDMAFALALQRDGKMVVGAEALTRYTSTGQVDPSFHVFAHDIYPLIYDLAIQPDGKIVAAGITAGNAIDVWVGRFEGDGADLDAPAAAPAQAPLPNDGGWNNGDVTISWNWTDGTGSGIDTANCTQQSTSTGEGALQLIATCRDLAGNQASAAYTVQVDKTLPAIVASADTAAGITWYNRDVTVHFTCSDALSGLALTCPPDQVLSAEGSAVASSAQVVADIAGNLSAPSNVVTVAIDKTAPVMGACPYSGPILANSGLLTLGPIAVDAGISGLNTGASTLTLPLATSSVGLKTLDFVAVDNGGNQAGRRCEYRVLYDFAGFFQPVDNLPVLNSVKAGSAVPVKFSLGGLQGLNIFASGYPASRQIACDSGVPMAEIEQTVTAGSSSLNYDAASGQYIYVWKTDKAWAGTCRQFVVGLADGVPHAVNFRFK
jgi:uncharacterized delta-60 repeat protein